MSKLASAVIVMLCLVVLVTGCRRDSNGGSTTQPDPSPVGDESTMTGKVVSQPPPTGQVGIEKWRFQPDGQTDKYLRLTRTRMEEAIPPEAKEIKLDEHAGKKIKVKYQRADDTWVWGAEVVD